jgi:lysophospholipase L1-like esterase
VRVVGQLEPAAGGGLGTTPGIPYNRPVRDEQSRGAAMEWYEDEVRELERIRGPQPSDPAPVVFYGSSSIRLWETLDDDFHGIGTVNLGFGGSTLAACAHFFPRLVPRCRPRSLLVYAGDNDLGDGRSPEDVLASLRDLLRQADALLGPIPIAFLSIKPSPARQYLDERIRRANALAREEIAARYEGRFIDVYPRMLDAAGRPRAELYAEDGLHLSRSGYRVWAATVMEYSPFLF